MASKKQDHRRDIGHLKNLQAALTAILNDKLSLRRAESTIGVPKKLSGKRWNNNMNKDGAGGKVKDVVRWGRGRGKAMDRVV